MTTTTQGGTNDSRMDAAHALLDVGIVSGGNGALDALAALASSAHCLDENQSKSIKTCSDVNAMEIDQCDHRMRPPPSAGYRRLRAVSNPEGMDKWEAASFSSHGRARAFSSDLGVFPEEEPLEAEEEDNHNYDKDENTRGGMSVTLSLIRALEERRGSDANVSSAVIVSSDEDTSSAGVIAASTCSSINRSRSSSISTTRSSSFGNAEDTDILRRARSRLLEEMIEVTPKNGSSTTNLPHSFIKYKNVSSDYNCFFSDLSLRFCLLL